MYELLWACLGAAIAWFFAIRKYARLERLVADPEVHKQLAALVSMCDERDSAHRDSDQAEKVIAAVRAEHADSFNYWKLNDHQRKEYDRASDIAETAEARFLEVYNKWLSFSSNLDALLKRHGVDHQLRHLLLRGHNPPATPHG